jgi:hypothetical protein
MAAAAPALSSADAQRVLKGEVLLAMARDAGATRVDLMGAVFYFDFNQNAKATQPQSQSQPAEQAAAPPPSSSSTLRDLLSKPPRSRGPALGVDPGTARPVRQPKATETQAHTQTRSARGQRKRRTPKRRTKTPAARPATLDGCCSAWRKKQQDKQQRRRREAAKPTQPQPQPKRRRQNARTRRSATRSARRHAAQRLQELLGAGTLSIQLKFAGMLLCKWRKARAARVAADPEAEAARLKARAGAAQAERRRAARAEAEARRAAQAAPMDTSEVGSSSTSKRRTAPAVVDAVPAAKRVPPG